MDYGFVLPLSLFITCLIFGNIHYTYLKYKDPKSNLVALILLIYAIYVFLIPSLYGVLTDFKMERSYNITSGRLILVYFFEIIFLSFFLMAFHSRIAKSIGQSMNSFVAKPHDKAEINLLLVFSLLMIGVYLNNILSLQSYGRIQQYDADVIAEGVGYFGIQKMIFVPLSALFATPGKISCAILATMPYNPKKGLSSSVFHIYKIVAWGGLILVAVYGLTVGVRHITLGVFILVFASGLLQRQNKYIWFFIVGFAFMVAIGPLIGSTYRTFLQQSSSSSLGVGDRLSTLKEMKSEAVEGYLDKLWNGIGTRLDDARLSAGLIKYVEREGHVGFNPILNTLYSPIPRLLWKTKPAPLSYDGTHKGLAGFVVWKETIGREWGLWGGYTAASHSWWELNLPGIIICSLIYGAFLRIMIKATTNKGYIGLLIFLLTIAPERFGGFFMKSLPDIILFTFQKLFPLLIIIGLWSKLSRFKILRK